MLLQILKGTPTWVFVLFAGLLVLGILQSRPRRLNIGQIALLPAAFIAFSLFGVISAFGTQALSGMFIGRALAILASRTIVPAASVQ